MICIGQNRTLYVKPAVVIARLTARIWIDLPILAERCSASCQDSGNRCYVCDSNQAEPDLSSYFHVLKAYTVKNQLILAMRYSHSVETGLTLSECRRY